MGTELDTSYDPRLDRILELIVQLASGNLDARGTPSDDGDIFDAVLTGLNMLAEELSWNTAKLRMLDDAVEEAHDDYFLVGENGCVNYANAAAANAFGYAAEEIVSLHIGELISKPDIEDTILPVVTEIGEWHGDVIGTQKNGETFPAELSISLVSATLGRSLEFLVVLIDTTEKRALEEQLRQAQKMEAVGLLAGGVAHDFNNILMGIQGFTQYASNQLEVDSQPHKDLAEVMALVERGASLTRQLLSFSRRQPMQLKDANLNDLIANAAKMLRRLIGENIDLQTSSTVDLGYVHVDPIQMDQVLINLAVNARDAMPAGGQLCIATANVDFVHRGNTPCAVMEPGRYVMLSVVDSGVGMSEETRQRVFEPFFTTKDIGKGTGLGLPTVYGIVKQHGGYIWIESAPDVGTTIKIYLPRVEASRKPSRHDGPEKFAPQGSETILLVEDEEAVRNTLCRDLESLGYKLLVAASGEEAELLVRDNATAVDLLVSDVVLPDWPGPVVYERLVAGRPALKVIFISGYAELETLRQAGIQEGTPFLQKPFKSIDLARKIREVLVARPVAEEMPVCPDEASCVTGVD